MVKEMKTFYVGYTFRFNLFKNPLIHCLTDHEIRHPTRTLGLSAGGPMD